MAQINQHNVNQTLAVADGMLADYAVDDIRRIRDALNLLHAQAGILVSDNDARLFWEWRSREWDMTWHTVPPGLPALLQTIEPWFQRWVDNVCEPETDDISY